MSETTLTDEINVSVVEKVTPIIEPAVMTVVASIGRMTAVIINEVGVVAKGLADDGMSLDDFSDVLTGKINEAADEEESDAESGSSDKRDS